MDINEHVKSRSERLIAAWPRPARQAEYPALVAVTGLPVSGKSFFARALALRSPIAVLSSDQVRMQLTDGAPRYDGPEHAHVFNVLGRLTKVLLAEGYHVLVDATGIRARDRRASLLAAREQGLRTAIVWCEVNEQVAAIRLAARAAGTDSLDYSQADASVRARMAARGSRPAPSEADLIMLVNPDTMALRIEELAAWLG